MPNQLYSSSMKFSLDVVKKWIVISIVFIMVILTITKLWLNWNTSDILALGQFLVEIIGFPLAIYSFMNAAREFEASQQLPEPNLYWELSNEQLVKSLELDLPLGSGIAQTPRLVLKNEGKNVTTWYLVEFDIPGELGKIAKLNTLIGEQVNTFTNDLHWYFETLSGKLSCHFMSNGKFALYPAYPQPLCEIKFIISGDEKYPEYCVIPFIIYSDKGKEAKGELTIKLVRKDQ